MRLSRLLLVTWLVWAADAAAQTRFEIPTSCGSEAEFRAELERLLGKDAGRALPVLLRIEPALESGQGYTLYLQLAGDSVREIHDPDCRALLHSAVVIAAAAVTGAAPRAADPDPAAPPAVTPTAAAPPPAEPAPPPRKTPVAAPVAAGPSPAPRPEPGARAPYAIFVGAGASLGVVPALSPSFELGADLEPRPWGLALTLHYRLAQTATLQGREVDIFALGARAAALFALIPEVGLLGGVEVNRLAGTAAANVSGGDSDYAWHLATALGINVIPWSIKHLRVELAVLGRAALVRPRFVVTGFGDVYRTPPFGGDAILRGAWLFP